MHSLLPVQQLLTKILHTDATRFPASRLAELDAAGWNALFHLAVELRVVPAVYQRLRTHYVAGQGKEETLAHFATYSRQVAKNNLRLFAQLQTVLRDFHQANISVMPLKGIWLAHEVYADKGMREMNDIDLLLRADDLPQAVHILTRRGYTSETPIHIAEQIQKSHHLSPLIQKGHAVIELHWNITRPGRPYAIDPGALWERARPGHIAGSDVLLPSPEDQLLHLALHTSYQHMFAFGLRPFYDIAATIEHFTPAIASRRAASELDWNRLCERCEQFGWQRGVRLALMLSRDLLGARVPQEALTRLDATEQGDQPLRSIAMEQLFTKKATAAKISLPVVEMLEEKSLAKKLRAAWNRIFVPEAQLRLLYSFEAGSPWRYYYYLVRLFWVVQNHTVSFSRLLVGDRTLSGVAQRKKQLQHWMNQQGG